MSTLSITDLFNTRIFRIPNSDYHRGYVWEGKQLNELWNDLEEISIVNEELKKHYIGAICLEETNQTAADKWHFGVKIYNIVDGQQRLTTISILLFELLKNNEIGYAEKKKKLIETYIYKSNMSGKSKVYKFCYDPMNKNYNFLLNFIFEDKKVVRNQVNLNYHTKNLLFAKKFFQDKIATLDNSQKNLLFKKITVSLQFDIRTIEKDLDGKAVFELIHNRGKLL